jgi:quinol-cytochrome oxidoreductase complex cytochrome b subunit
MKATIHKAVAIPLIALFFCAVVGLRFLDDYFYRTRPRKPEPQSGHIYPQWIHHGTRVYLTKTEKLPFDLFWILVIGNIVTVFILDYCRRHPADSKDDFTANY